jgi:murein DD-endopeptidase / murein LD-carboxypeptidase
MARSGEEIARAARMCIGVPFRPQGRDPQRALDCVGVAGFAFGREDLPRGYALRGGLVSRIGAELAARGLRPIEGDQAAEGDLLLIESGPRQLHFAVKTGRGFVHADARLRRVVETPGQPPWPVIGVWREGGE